MDGAGRDGNRRVGALVAAAAFVVVLAVLVGLGAFRDPGSPGRAPKTPGSGEYSRISTYKKQVPSYPGLSYTENFATLECDPGDLLLSGGFSGVDEGTAIVASAPDAISSAEVWLVGWENDASPDSINVAVLCAEGAFPPHEEGS